MKNRGVLLRRLRCIPIQLGIGPGACSRIPTLGRQRTGNFGAFPAVIYDPSTTTCRTTGICSRTPFAATSSPPTDFAGLEIAAVLSPDPTNGNIQNNLPDRTARYPDHAQQHDRQSAISTCRKSIGSTGCSARALLHQFYRKPGARDSALPLPYTQARIVAEHVPPRRCTIPNRHAKNREPVQLWL